METWTNPKTGKLEGLGCYCDMEVKSSMLGANCFLVERGITGVGWPLELNKSYIREQRTKSAGRVGDGNAGMRGMDRPTDT